MRSNDQKQNQLAHLSHTVQNKNVGLLVQTAGEKVPLKTLFKIKTQNFSFLPQPLSTCNIVIFKRGIYSPQA